MGNYVKKIGPQAVKNLSDGDEIDLKLFWKSSCYCTTTIGSYNVETSFSAYKPMLENKRRSLDTDSIKAFHFLNWNLQIKSALEEETGKTQEKPKKRPVPDVIKLVKANKEMNVETEKSQKPTSEIDNQHDSSSAPKRSKLKTILPIYLILFILNCIDKVQTIIGGSLKYLFSLPWL